MKTTHEKSLLDRVRAALVGQPQVQEKRMFGSTGFMVRGHLCVSVRATRIMCRIDPALHASALKRSGCKTVVMKGRPYVGWVYVDAAALEEHMLLRWVRDALEFNGRLAAECK